LLAEDDTSPAAWIRHRRLAHCRLDLANPRLNARPIEAIAERWGFTIPTHFSRLFRAIYGIPPRDCRNLPPARARIGNNPARNDKDGHCHSRHPGCRTHSGL
jgi:AraC-like DNA-binding protein